MNSPPKTIRQVVENVMEYEKFRFPVMPTDDQLEELFCICDVKEMNGDEFQEVMCRWADKYKLNPKK